MNTRVREWSENTREDPKHLLYFLVLGSILLYLFRGCIPGLNRNQLPAELLDEFTRSHVECVGIDELQVWPGDHRQPECGQVNVEWAEEGTIPASEAETGVKRAVCFQVTIENPRWHTMAQTRHEIVTFEHTLYKVAVLKDGEWQTSPDDDKEDEQHWIDYKCPGEYKSE